MKGGLVLEFAGICSGAGEPGCMGCAGARRRMGRGTRGAEVGRDWPAVGKVGWQRKSVQRRAAAHPPCNGKWGQSAAAAVACQTPRLRWPERARPLACRHQHCCIACAAWVATAAPAQRQLFARSALASSAAADHGRRRAGAAVTGRAAAGVLEARAPARSRQGRQEARGIHAQSKAPPGSGRGRRRGVSLLTTARPIKLPARHE